MATAEWKELYDCFYRRHEIYDMLWTNDVDISRDRCELATAAAGGPIGIISCDRSARRHLRIFTSAGSLLSGFTWKHPAPIGMGWSDEEALVCVLRDGTVLLFSIHGDTISQFTLGKECKSCGIAECHIWGNGLVARLEDTNTLIAISNFLEPQRLPLASIDFYEAPASTAIIPPHISESGNLEVLIATNSGTVIVVDEFKAEDQLLTTGPYTRMSVSPCGTLLACFSDDGTLYCISSDFKRNVSEFSTRSTTPPIDLCWCKDEAVVVLWPKLILLVGLLGHFIRFDTDGILYLQPECDGVRLVGEFVCEILQKVPECTQNIFRIGSVAPSALLYDAAESFERSAANAHELVRTLDDQQQLPRAVDECLEAAAREFDSKFQKRLLKAASYGKLFLSSFDSDAFTTVCRSLRILNSVRDYSVGLPLTYDQYLMLTPQVLIDRLLNRHHHGLCLKICNYLNLPVNKVLVNWACNKAVADDELSEKEIAAIIVSRLKNVPAISFAEVATAAYRAHRGTIATTLLEHEPRSADQVPLLISMNEGELALKKSIDSGDTDLIYLALLHIKRNRSKSELFRLIKNKPIAANLLIEYCKHDDVELLKNCYYFLQRPHMAADLAVVEAYKQKSLSDRIRGLELAMQFYQDDKNDSLAANATEEQIRLLQLEAQQELQLLTEPSAPSEGGGGGRVALVDMSVSDLLDHYLSRRQVAKASKLQQLFNVPAKRFWHIQVQVYARTHQWKELFALVHKKKPPIGYLPFVEACLREQQTPEALRYINLLSDEGEKMEQLVAIGCWRQAAEVAIASKNMDALQTIRSSCNDDAVQNFIDQAVRS